MNVAPRFVRASSSLPPLTACTASLHRRSLITITTFNLPPTSSLTTTLQTTHRLQRQRRHLIAPPQPGQGPLMERRPDRALPEIRSPALRWLRTVPLFIALITVSALAIFNYQKSSSSVVNATLYALRTSEKAREILGEEIYFRDRFPWIWGELNQLHGRIDIGFGVKGRRANAYMRFRSFRRSRSGYFVTEEWSLETEDGRVINLLEDDDPFKRTMLQADPSDAKQQV